MRWPLTSFTAPVDGLDHAAARPPSADPFVRLMLMAVSRSGVLDTTMFGIEVMFPGDSRSLPNPAPDRPVDIRRPASGRHHDGLPSRPARGWQCERGQRPAHHFLWNVELRLRHPLFE